MIFNLWCHESISCDGCFSDLMAKISKSSQIGEDHKDDDDREWDEENLC